MESPIKDSMPATYKHKNFRARRRMLFIKRNSFTFPDSRGFTSSAAGQVILFNWELGVLQN